MILRHYKGEPNAYVIRYRGGRRRAHGAGLDFWYLPYNTSIAAIPSMTQDAPFIFNEATASFQEVAIQGQLTYRLESPLDTAELLDFTIDPRTGRYRSSDPDKLTQRVINAVQAHTRKGVNELSLEQARLPWDSDQLIYSVREPFPSKASQASLVFGSIAADRPLTLTSQMADNGVIFSDGMEDDFLAFNAGSTAKISLAPNTARLVVAA
jgi:hypothetical protein